MAKFKEELITIDTVFIESEGRFNGIASSATEDTIVPYVGLSYTVEADYKKYKVSCLNQRYNVGDSAGVIIRGDKCELLYDAIFYTAKPFCLNNPEIVYGFFDGEEVKSLSASLITYKKKLFESDKKRKIALAASWDAVSADALIIRRENKGEWMALGSRWLRYELTVLIKTSDGYVVTKIKDTDRPELFNGKKLFKQTFTFSTGEIIPVIYRESNVADIMIDYDNVVPFSFEEIPYVSK